MNRYLPVALFICLLPSMLAAQPAPNGGPGNPPPPDQPGGIMPMGAMMINPRNAAVEVTPNGLFLLAEGVLARYSPDLEQCVTLRLLGPLPPMPMGEGDDARRAQQVWFRERILRSSPAVMLPSGEQLYLVFANTFFSVNQITLKMEKIPLDPPLPIGDDRVLRNAALAPLLKLQGDTLYIIRQADLLAVDLKAGTILKRAGLPHEMAPPMPQPMPPGPQQKPPFQDEAARAITVVGALSARQDGNHAVYTLKDDNGAIYSLTGDHLDGLVGAGKVDGRRARISGTLETRPEMPAGVKGLLHVETFQLL